MARRSIYSVVLAWVCLISTNATATSFIDPYSNDPDALCRGSNQVDQEAIYKERAAAVFSVLVTGKQGLEPKGTATLLDDERGLFVTAAHVVHFYRDAPIFVSQASGPVKKGRRYAVRIYPAASFTDDWQTKDFVLLQAENWDHPPEMTAFPLRIDGVNGFIKGFFIGHAEDVASSVIGDFGAAFGDRHSSETISFSGVALPHASGTLLLDIRGRAFALILRDSETPNIPVASLTTRQLRPILWSSDHFSALPLRRVIDKVKAIPPSANAQDLIDRLMRTGYDDDFGFRLQRTSLGSIDVVHLVDSLFSDRLWSKVQDKLANVLTGMAPVVAHACTHKYFADALASMFLRTTTLPAPQDGVSGDQRSELGGASFTVAQRNGSLGSKLNTLNQQASATVDAGLLMLQQALAQRDTSPEVARVEARLAAGLFRKPAEHPIVLQALSMGVQDRNFAVLMGNLAVAEDASGDKAAARSAIVRADALGGSSSAYYLAADYAREEHDQVAAMGLLARAYLKLPEDNLRASSQREMIRADFNELVATTSSSADTTLEQYRVPRSNAVNVSRWRDLAAGNTGLTYAELGASLFAKNSADAETLLSRALDADEKAFGRDHPKVAVDLQNLASVYVAGSRYEHARQVVERALLINVRSFGEKDRSVGISKHNLGVIFRQQREYDKAVQLFSGAVEISKEWESNQKSKLVTYELQYLASIYALRGEYEEAEKYYREALKQSQASEVKDRNEAVSLYNLAVLAIGQNRTSTEVASFLESVVSTDRSTGNVESLKQDLSLLAQVYYRLGDVERAKNSAAALREISPTSFWERMPSGGLLFDGTLVLPDGRLRMPDGRTVAPRIISIEEWLKENRLSDSFEDIRRPSFTIMVNEVSGRPVLYPFD